MPADVQVPSAEAETGRPLDLSTVVLNDLNRKIVHNLKQRQGIKSQQTFAVKKKIGLNESINGVERGTRKNSQSEPPSKRHHERPPAALSAPQGTQGRGTKRSHNGKAKVSKERTNAKSDVNKTKLGPRASQGRKKNAGDLRDDVAALGGGAEDLELIAGEETGSEVDGDEGKKIEVSKRALRSELQGVVRNLGIDTAAQSDGGHGDSDIESDGNVTDVAAMKPQNAAITQGGSRKGALRQLNGYERVVEASNAKKRGIAQLKIPPQANWCAVDIVHASEETPNIAVLPPKLTDSLHEQARTLLEKENTEYAIHHGASSTEKKFYSTLMSTGTMSDKISALTLSVQESPLHNMKSLENLVALARKRSREQAVNVLGALKDLFGPGDLLPSSRRLRTFATQPQLLAAFQGEWFNWTPSSSLPHPLSEAHLICWAFEDWLKSMYFEVLKILENWCNDEVAFARAKAVDYVALLLREKPEQEANLLRLLINKLGDIDKKIASKTSYQILQIETTHPLMKPILVSAIESDLLFRPGQSLHAQYYAVITLNQTVLSVREESVARKLLEIYFGLFVKLLENPRAIAEKLSTTGANKISINKKGEIQGGGSAGGKKAQKKVLDRSKSTAVEEDLREKMLSAVLTGVNRAIPYTNTNDASFEKHIETLFRVTHSSNFNTSIQALILIQQLSGAHQGSPDRFYRVLYESLLDPRLLTSSKQALYLNLLFRALRADSNIGRVQAFVKRLLQVIAMHQPPFVCGVLYLLREIEKIFPALSVAVDSPEEDISDDEEIIRDVPEDSNTLEDGSLGRIINNDTIRQRYDPRKRDPVHANATHSPLWELPSLTAHYHPSVTLFTTRLLGHDPMPPKPDLQQNTLISFLDKFVYKTPKTSVAVAAKGTSIMQPLISGGVEDGSVLLSATSGSSKARAPVNSESFWRRGIDKVGPDEVFFHQYFSTIGVEKDKAKRKKEKKERKKRGGSADAEGSGSEEEEIWRALVESKPDIEGNDEEDVEFSDDEELVDALRDDPGSDVSLDSMSSDDEEDLPDLDEASSESELHDGQGLDDQSDDQGSLHKLSSTKDSSTAREIALAAEPGTREKRSARKRRIKSLPTFADAEEYAKLLDEEMEDGR